MIFLGTGAAEMVPNPFCTCEVCRYAWAHPEEMRMRSAFQMDEKTVIDFGPDVFAAAQRFGVHMDKMEDMLFTHLHGDHFCFENMDMACMCVPKREKPFRVHLSQEGYDNLMTLRRAVNAVPGKDDNVKDHIVYDLIPHKVFESFKAGTKTVLPVRAFHGGAMRTERGVYYRITQEDGKTLLYALDTGVYPEETAEALSGFPVDILIMDGTFGSRLMDDACTHLDFHTFISQLDKLTKHGVVTESTKIYASHIAHHNHWPTDEYSARLSAAAGREIVVARDGMRIDW